MRLSVVNQHERDLHITFQEEGHKYTLDFEPNVKYTSCTTVIHHLFPSFDADKVIANIFKSRNHAPGSKYWGMTASNIKEMWNANGLQASCTGTALHNNIEIFMNQDASPLFADAAPDDVDHSTALYSISVLMMFYEMTHSSSDNTGWVVDTFVPTNWYPFQSPAKLQDAQAVNKALFDRSWQYFLHFARDFGHLVPYRTEWLIYWETNGIKISGSIDMVFLEEDDDTSASTTLVSIYDWKCCKNIEMSYPANIPNHWKEYSLHPALSSVVNKNGGHYTCQLNIYKYILEHKYGMRVKDLCLVRFHGDSDNYERIPVPDIQDKIELLWTAMAANATNTSSTTISIESLLFGPQHQTVEEEEEEEEEEEKEEEEEEEEENEKKRV